MILLSVFWAVFAVMFFALGIFHWNMRNKGVAHLQLESEPMPEGVTIEAKIAGVDFVDFASKFNHYIEYYNQTTKKQHKIQAIGYWVATAVAIFSLSITLIG